MTEDNSQSTYWLVKMHDDHNIGILFVDGIEVLFARNILQGTELWPNMKANYKLLSTEDK
jgi:hypothetical protein